MEVFGFSSHDALLLFYCPLFAVIGGIAHTYVLWTDYSKLPDQGSFVLASHRVAFYRIAWLFGRLLLSLIAGLIFSLYLVGALTSTPAATARILAFSILIGYAAPKLWITQETVITEAIENRFKKILKEYEQEKMASQMKAS